MECLSTEKSPLLQLNQSQTTVSLTSKETTSVEKVDSFWPQGQGGDFYIVECWVGLQQTNGQAMSSEDVALYLYEVGSNQRKLEYCRQILAANPNFTPEAIFNLNSPQSKNTLSRNEFIQIIKSLGIACNQQESELLFAYFQIDGKNYLNFEEFSTLIIPQSDASLKNLINKRRYNEFRLDYSLRFCLQKFFFQIIENQVKLEIMCRFAFQNKGKDEKKLRNKKLDAGNLKEFLGIHGKYPQASISELILREIAQNKGENKRNRLITEYILEYNEKAKMPNPVLPKIIAREPSVFVSLTTKYEKDKENTSNITNAGKLDLSQNSLANPLYVNNPLQELTKKIAASTNVPKSVINPMDSLSEVENRIKTLMSTISIKGSNSPVKKQSRFDKSDKILEEELPIESQKRQTTSSIDDTVKNMKEQIRKEKLFEKVKDQNKYESKSKKTQNQRETPYNRFNSEYSEVREITDRERVRNRFDFDLEANKTDRFAAQKNKRITEENFDNESNSSSRIVLKPKSRAAASVVSQKIDSSSANNNRKRIDYLKSLIEDKEEGRAQEVRLRK